MYRYFCNSSRDNWIFAVKCNLANISYVSRWRWSALVSLISGQRISGPRSPCGRMWTRINNIYLITTTPRCLACRQHTRDAHVHHGLTRQNTFRSRKPVSSNAEQLSSASWRADKVYASTENRMSSDKSTAQFINSLHDIFTCSINDLQQFRAQ